MTTEPRAFVPRMEGLDALRGFALFGLFIVHMPELFELYWAHPVTDPVQLVWHDTVFTIFAGKAFALLALCFGVSFFIIMDRSAQKGIDFSGRFVWRLLVLFVIGTAHAIWYRGDILQVLALTGLLVIPFYRVTSNAVVLMVGALFLMQPLILVQIVSGLNGADWANQPLKFWSAAMSTAYTEGGFIDTIQANIREGHGFKWLFMYESGRLSQIVGLSLIGLVLARMGYFRAPERFRALRLTGLIGSVIAIAVFFAAKTHLPALVPATESMYMPKSLTGSLMSGLFDLSIMFTLFFGFTALYYGFGGRVLNALAPAGRMTLTLYLVQSLLFVPFFYHYGLNQHAILSQSSAVLLGLAAFAVQVVIAHLWFKRFLYGPFEWLWRAATYLSVKVPFRRKNSA